MVEPILYASLGALLATLVGLTFLPFFWQRAVRLTTKQLVHRLPVSASEIVAGQDRLRAEQAMSMRAVERKAERAIGDATRDRVDSARARATELGHLADLADLRGKVAALESEGARVKGELDRTGEHASTLHAAIEEARAAADAAGRDLQAARQDASASRASTDQARAEAAAREAEIARLRAELGRVSPMSPSLIAVPTDAKAEASPPRMPKADNPFDRLSAPLPSRAAEKPALAAAAEQAAPAKSADAEQLAALRARLDEVADMIVKASEDGPPDASARARSAQGAPERVRLVQPV